MENVTGFQFDQFIDYFKYRLRKETVSSSGEKTLNLESFAKSLGYTPSSLSMILNGSRLPSDSLLTAFFDYLDVSMEEREYLRTLVQLEKLKRKGKNTEQTLSRLERFPNASSTHKINLKRFSYMQDWYVLAIQTLIASSSFRENAVWISRKLRKKVTTSQVTKAIEILLELGLVKRNPTTNELQIAVGTIETAHEIPSDAIREHHKGMIHRSLEAIDEQSVPERQFNSTTFLFDAKDLSAAKKRILDFVIEFNNEFKAKDSDRVYQMNVQFFEHTVEEKKDQREKNHEVH